MNKPSSFFTKLIESGQFTIDEHGHAILLGEYIIMFPSKAVLELIDTLEDKLGFEEAQKILLHVAETQVNEGYKRYLSRFHLEKIDKRKIADFTIDILNTLGWGSVMPKKISFEDKTFEFVSKDTTMPIRFKEKHKSKSESPVDTYLLGILKRIFECVFEVELEAEETECMATGGRRCVFTGRPKL